MTLQVRRSTGRIAGSTWSMEHLIALLSWSFFPLLSQKSSIIYAPVSDRLGALLPRCEPRSLRFSSLPQWPTWCVPKWEFVKWTARWPTWRAASRLRRSSQVCPVAARSAWCPLDVSHESFCRLAKTGCHKGQPYVNDPKVKSFIQWTKTLKDNAVLEKTAIGGHYCYPHPPQKCPQTSADSSGEKNQQTVSVPVWNHQIFYSFSLALTCF